MSEELDKLLKGSCNGLIFLCVGNDSILGYFMLRTDCDTDALALLKHGDYNAQPFKFFFFGSTPFPKYLRRGTIALLKRLCLVYLMWSDPCKNSKTS